MTTYRVTATANDEPTIDDIEAESPDQAWAEACKKHRLVRLYNGKVEELPTRAELLAKLTALETAGRDVITSIVEDNKTYSIKITPSTYKQLKVLAALLGETK